MASDRGVLIVVNDGDVRAMLARILRNCGYAVYHAGDVDDATAMVVGRSLDLVVLDPEPDDGLRLLDTLRAGIPVILLSAPGGEPLGDPRISMILHKPFSVFDLEAAATRLTSRRLSAGDSYPPRSPSVLGSTVLVADDDADVRRTMADILGLAGYRTLQAADGEEALRRVHHQQVDVLVLDLHMPKRKGLSVLEALGPPPPVVVVLSGFVHFSPLDLDRLGLGGRVFRVLRKPVPPVGLLSAVDDAVRELHRLVPDPADRAGASP